MLVILDSGNGQMCNKIIMHINILASAYERGFKVRYYNLERFDGPMYDQEKLNNIISERKSNPRVRKHLAWKLYEYASKFGLKHRFIINAENEDEVNYALSPNRLKKMRIWSWGWPFYDLETLRKNKDIIREYLRPNDEIANKSKAFLEKLSKHKNNCIFVGVHLRRGDYKVWFNGKYYFDNKTYKRYMDMLYDELPDKTHVIFILFSNEKIIESDFQDDRYEVVTSNGSAVEDLYLMSECNYLIGPPSTFNGLASFIGNVPKYGMADDSSTLKMEDMRVWLIQTDNWINPYDG